MSIHATETALLAELIDARAKAKLVEPHNSVILKESGADAKLKKLTIQHLDRHALVVLPEKGQTADHRYSPMFGFPAGWSHHQACDAIVFLHWKSKDYLVLIDLKSRHTKGCEQQIKSTEHFVEYVFSILQNQKGHKRHTRTIRRVVFNTAKTVCQTINKLPVNPRTAIREDVTFIKVSNNAIVSPADFC